MAPRRDLLIELRERRVIAVKRLIGDALRVEIIEERCRLFLTPCINKVNSRIFIYQRVIGERDDFHLAFGQVRQFLVQQRPVIVVQTDEADE